MSGPPLVFRHLILTQEDLVRSGEPSRHPDKGEAPRSTRRASPSTAACAYAPPRLQGGRGGRRSCSGVVATRRNLGGREHAVHPRGCVAGSRVDLARRWREL
jgi:hypothetical protein